MEYSVLITESFKHDVVEAVDYIDDRLGSPSAAKKLLDAIDNVLGFVQRMPEMHAVSTKPRLNERGIRECLVEHYVITYRIDGLRIVVLRLFHQTQDYERFM